MCPYSPITSRIPLMRPSFCCLCPLIRLIICMHTSTLVDLSPILPLSPTFPLRFDDLIDVSLSLDLFLFFSLCCSLYSRKDICTSMFIAAQFTIAKIWKQPKCPSADEWIKKLWYIYTMEYYAVVKKNEFLPFVTTWMEMESIMLSEISQAN